MGGHEEYELEEMEETYSDEPEVDEAGEDTTGEPAGETLTMTQEELNALLDRRLARERKASEKRLKKIFGTTDIDKASAYYRAGVAVSDASGAPPEEVYERVRGNQTNQEGGSTMSKEPDVTERLRRIEDLLYTDREEASRAVQEQEAKQEFGDLYEASRDDIEDYAEEKGLSLVEAAAIVLRPKLRDYYADRNKAAQDAKRRRKVDPTSDSPAKGAVNYDTELTAQERAIAKKMGLSLKDYYDYKRK